MIWEDWLQKWKISSIKLSAGFLELDLISSHDVILPDFSGHHYQVCGGSLAEPQG
jgi:hypothetical protein